MEKKKSELEQFTIDQATHVLFGMNVVLDGMTKGKQQIEKAGRQVNVYDFYSMLKNSIDMYSRLNTELKERIEREKDNNKTEEDIKLSGDMDVVSGEELKS